MTALAPQVEYDPTRDKRYRDTAIGPEIVAWLDYLELGGMSPRTLEDYERYVARGAMLYPDLALTEWTDAELLRIAKRYPVASRRVRVAAWKSFFKWARVTRRISENPTDLLPTFKQKPQPVIDVFSEAEVQALLSLPVVDAAPLAVLLEAGLRKAEARALTLRRCLPESGRVVVIKGKGGKDRIVPMTPMLQSLLADLALVEGLELHDHIFYRVHANDVVTRRRRDKPIGEGTFARWWARCIEQAGVRYRKPHTARHTFATRWYQRGLRTEDIQMMLGHASPATTSGIYVHTGIEDVAARMEELESLRSRAHE